MATIALKTPGRVEFFDSILQLTCPAGADLEAGSPMIFDDRGRFKLALATSVANGQMVWIAGRKARYGEGLTGFRIARMDGFDLSALAYGAPVYLADDGTLADAPGTKAIILARVIPAWAVTMGNYADKILQVQCNEIMLT